MDLEQMKRSKNNGETVFLRMSETANRPLEVKPVSVKKILSEISEHASPRGDVIKARVKLKGGRSLLVFSDQLFSSQGSAELGYEENEQNQPK